MRSRRDQAYAIQMGRRACELLQGAQGGGGIFNHSQVQRCNRDLAGVAAHIAGNWDMPAVNYGQVILGGPPPADPIF